MLFAQYFASPVGAEPHNNRAGNVFATIVLRIGIVGFDLSTACFYLFCVAGTKPKPYVYAPYITFMSFLYVIGRPRNEAWHPAYLILLSPLLMSWGPITIL
jgi:hypothetical protein